MKANLREVTRALDAPSPEIRFILLHGPDEAGSEALAKRLERAMGSGAERIDLEGATLRSDPARLPDEAAALSLFGDKRYIRIRPAGEDAVPALEALLEAERADNPVIAIAGQLKPSSALFKLALASKKALSFASFAPDQRAAEGIAIALGRDLGLRLPNDLARQIAESCANDRSVMAQELEKIALYLDAAPDRPVEVTPDAIEAIGASISDTGLSRLCEAVMSGRPGAAGNAISQLAQDNVAVVAMLRALQKRVSQITELRVDVGRTGRSPTEVVDSRGKAVFFREKPGIIRDIGRWPDERLANAAARLIAAERTIKSSGNAGESLGEAEIILMARAAARLR